MRTPFALALGSLSLLACSSPSRPAPKPAEPAPVVVEPAPVAPAPEDPEATRLRRVTEALARVPALKDALAALRGLAFTKEVPAEYQATDDFRAFVGHEIDAELGDGKGQAISAAYHHMGLLATDVDLSQTLQDAMVSQAAAYYDPKQATFFVVMVPKDDFSLDTIAVHELTHALQDQHFDLQAYLSPGGATLDDDAAHARKFVVEGEATLTMMVYGAEKMLGGKQVLSPELLPMIKPGFQQAAAMTLDDFKASTKQQAAGAAGVDDDIQKSIDAMDSIPPLILVPMMDSYMKGMLVALAAYEAGGWPEVATLYSNPPQSTEQVLHPETKLYPTRDLPRKVTLPALEGYTEVLQNTMGELQWRVFFMLWNKAVAEPAAAGWDGDRWAVLKAADGTMVGVAVTVWDAPAEATEFAQAYQAAVKARFPAGERTVWVETKGASVYIVDGGRDATLIKKLIKGAKIGP